MSTMTTQKAQIENVYPLTPLQLGVLFHAMYAPDGAAYFEQLFCRLDGDVDVARLEQALAQLSQRHPILRTAFVSKGQRDPVQVLFDRATIPLTVHDWRDRDAATQQADFEALLTHDQQQRFRLNRPPLMRITLVQFGAREWRLVWSHHHILLDGWSMQLLLKDFFALMLGHVGPAPAPFSDYLAWLARQPRDAALTFWRETLGDLDAPTPLGIDSPAVEGVDKVFAEDRYTLDLPQLADTAAACRVSVGTVLLGAWGILLGRYSGQEDVTFGVTMSGRAVDLRGVDEMVGLLISTAPLRLALPRHRAVTDWLSEVQQAQFALQQHFYCGLADIHTCSGVPAGMPLFESLVAIDNFPLSDLQFSEQLPFEVSAVDMMERNHYPISLTMVPGAEGVSLKLGYDRSRISEAAAVKLAADYEQLLAAFTAQSIETVEGWMGALGRSATPVVTQPLRECPVTTDLCTQFEAMAAQHRDAVAVSGDGVSLTYAELDGLANRLAWRLREQGIGTGAQEDRVGLSVERDPALVIGILGILKAGGAYVPLDPAYPAERLHYLVSDSGIQAVVGDETGLAALSDAAQFTPILLDGETAAEAPPRHLHPQQAAYVIYTSGSTGQPKGCVVSHANVLRLFTATDHYGFGPQDVWSLFHSYAFDFSVWELWGALLHGGRVVVVPYLISRDPARFAALLEDEQVTVLSQTPAAFRQLLSVSDTRDYPALRLVTFGGEALVPSSLKRWYDRHGDRVRLVNMYGITETTVHVTEHTLDGHDITQSTSVIGAPISDLSLQVLDRYGEPVPTGVAGELHVGGAGVTRGYLGRPGLTAQRFVPDAYGTPGARVYRSGDLGRRLPDGGLVYAGRADHQIKLRGFRIELGEIEAALRGLNGVREAVVILDTPETGEPRLVGYVVGEGDASSLREALSQRLPVHMVPAILMPLDALPLTAHGKVDTKALPAPTHQVDHYVAPQTPEQQTLATIWQNVLGVDRVGLTDNYFALGGDSIHSIRIVSQAEAKGISLSIEDLFQKLTIERLTEAPAVAEAAEAPALDAFGLLSATDRRAAPEDAVDSYPLSQLQAGMLFHTDYGDDRKLYHDVFSYRLETALDPARIQVRLRQLSAAYPILRSSFALAGLDQPVQWVHAQAEIPVVVEDLRALSEAARHTAVGRARERLHDDAFDPATPPLLRLVLQQLGDRQWQASFAIHHVILDGWSVASLLSSMLQADAPAPALDHGFRDFIALEQQSLRSEDDRAFWQQQVQDLPDTTLPRWPLATVPQGADRAGTYRQTCSPELYTALRALACQQGCALKSVLLAVHACVLAYWSGDRNVVTGLVTNGRPENERGAETLGLFLNTLPMRLDTGHMRWSELLAAVRQAEGAQLAHRRFPMAEVQRMRQGRPLFETSFNFVDFHVYHGVIGDDKAVKVSDETSIQSFDIPMGTTFAVNQAAGVMHVALSYDAASFPPAQAQAIAETYVRVAEALVAGPDTHYAERSLVPDAMLTELLTQRGQGASPHAPVPSVVEAIRAAARQTPTAVAVQSATGQLDYQTLDRQSDALAAHLLAQGVQPDRPIALMLDRSPTLVVAMLAALKAACPYIPLDTQQPAGRLAEICEDARPQVTLTLDAQRHALPALSGTVVAVDALPPMNGTHALPAVHSDTLAYVLFTSGSTGRPKGVGVTAGALANHMAWMQRCFPLAQDDRVLQKTPIGFDASVWEFWAPLMAGATLVLAEEGLQRDADALLSAVQAERITVLQVVPSVLDILLQLPEMAHCDALRRVFVGGEALQPSTIERFEAVMAKPLINLYGPTEATIDSSYAVYRGNAGAAVSLGEPIDGAALYVLDDRLQPVGVGIDGELWISGAGLARGYWGRAADTADRFRPDPFSSVPGRRMYRSGDVVRWLPDGGLHYLGRRDGQVKLRGNRVELAEIEMVLARQPGVTRSAVVMHSPKGTRAQLVAYVLGNDATTPERVLEGLRARLPSYMLPQRIVPIDLWPLTPNGKTDYAALPALAPAPEATDTAATAAEGASEQALLTVWQKLLSNPAIGVTDNFFALGGDSILAMQIAAEMRRTGWAMVPRQLFEHPTVRLLAAEIEPLTAAPTPAPAVIDGPLPLTPIQRWFFTLPMPHRAHWNQAVMLDVPASLPPHRLHRALDTVIAAHDAFRLRFEQTDRTWTQHFAADAGQWYRSVDMSDLPETAREDALTALAEQTQRALSLDAGPLLNAVHIDHGVGQPGRLLLVIHHLIVDGISWRILLNDLALALAGQPIPPAETSLGQWLSTQATRTLSPATRAYWQAQAERVKTAGQTLGGAERMSGDGRNGATQTLEHVFDRDTTQRLLSETATRLKARPVELLLTAVARALQTVIHQNVLAVTMEGHGRDVEVASPLERTVGWFTALYPLVCALDDATDAPSALRCVKQALRAVADGGVGYGQLQADDAQGDWALPTAAFNYLGQFNDQGDEGGLTLSHASVGTSEDPDGQRPHVLDIVALIHAGELRLRWVFDERAPDQATMNALAEAAQAHLLELIACNEARATWRADDFPLAGIDEAQLPMALGMSDERLADLWQATPTQEGMLFHSRLEGEASAVYLEQVVIPLEGDVDARLLAQAFNDVVNHHEALRTSFVWDGLERPLQQVWHQVDVPFEQVDADEGEPEAALQAFLQRDSRRGLALDVAPLMRVSLINRHGRAWRLVWTHHHAILDGWSMALIFGALTQRYSALLRGESAWPGTAPSYREYVRWLSQRSAAQDTEPFWREYLRDVDTVTRVGSEAEATSQHEKLSCRLEAEPLAHLRRIAATHQVTLNTLVQGAYAVALSRQSGHRDVLFGVTVSGRPPELAQVEAMVGLFIATLPMRVDCSGSASVAALMQRVQADQGAIEQHAFARAVDIQRWSGREARQPLFDSVLIYENYPIDRGLSGASAALGIGAVSAHDHPHYAFSLYVKPDADDLVLEAVFDPQRVAPDVAKQMLSGIDAILRQLAAGATHIGALQLADDTSVLALPAPAAAPTVLAMLTRAAAADPSKRAISGPSRQLSYAQLVAESRAFGARLVAEGVQPGMRVAIGLQRDADMLVALLGVLWSGAQYVPIDPALPVARRTMMLDDAAPYRVIVDASTAAHFSGQPLLHYTPDDQPVAALPGDHLAGDALAYTLFTSGSTGRPKGVQISHRALSNLLLQFRDQPGLKADDRLLAVTTLSFDIAALELLLPLCCGAEVVIASTEASTNGTALTALLADHQITVMQATPASWRLLLGSHWTPPAAFCAWCGGEALPLELAQALTAHGITLWNVYGPTETTIWSAISPVAAEATAPLPIGAPIRGTTLYVLDHEGHRLPTGVTGQLAIGGDGLAMGYLNDPRQTAQRFQPDPFSGRAGDRLYLTGDLARARADGTFDVLGRLDHQIKLNGYRMELGDIEAALHALPGVNDAAAAVHAAPNGQQQLVAYLVASETTPDDAACRTLLAERLPRFMVPAVLLRLERLPLTPNGKLDRKALLPPDPHGTDASTPSTPPEGPVEAAICAIWSSVFAVETIGAEDDFYALGGHSLLATQIHTRLTRIFRISPPLGEVFRATTPRALSAVVQAHAGQERAEKHASAFLHLRSLTPEQRAALRNDRASLSGTDA